MVVSLPEDRDRNRSAGKPGFNCRRRNGATAFYGTSLKIIPGWDQFIFIAVAGRLIQIRRWNKPFFLLGRVREKIRSILTRGGQSRIHDTFVGFAAIPQKALATFALRLQSAALANQNHRDRTA